MRQNLDTQQRAACTAFNVEGKGCLHCGSIMVSRTAVAEELLHSGSKKATGAANAERTHAPRKSAQQIKLNKTSNHPAGNVHILPHGSHGPVKFTSTFASGHAGQKIYRQRFCWMRTVVVHRRIFGQLDFTAIQCEWVGQDCRLKRWDWVQLGD